MLNGNHPHRKVICRVCDAVMAQCRCPDSDKPIAYSVCSKCQQKAATPIAAPEPGEPMSDEEKVAIVEALERGGNFLVLPYKVGQRLIARGLAYEVRIPEHGYGVVLNMQGKEAARLCQEIASLSDAAVRWNQINKWWDERCVERDLMPAFSPNRMLDALEAIVRDEEPSIGILARVYAQRYLRDELQQDTDHYEALRIIFNMGREFREKDLAEAQYQERAAKEMARGYNLSIQESERERAEARGSVR